MTEILTFVLTWIAGVLLGAIFFGGLWWTVQKGVSSKFPALLFLGSLVLRMSIVLLGFYLLGGGQWQRMLLCLLGFFMARFLIIRLVRPDTRSEVSSGLESNHAS